MTSTPSANALPSVTAPSVTVTVLTYNGDRYLDDILTAIEAQQYHGAVDVLVIDSGSTDGTLGIVAAHPTVRLHEIPNSEFGHGKTRDLAANLATGDIVAYLTHDAIPASPHWLSALVAPMADDERIVAVLGSQLPRPGCHPMLKYEIRSVFASLGPTTGTTVFRDDGRFASRGELEAAAFYSDVNAAARRDVLTGPVPYRHVSYAEDQMFGRDLLDAGFRKAYAPTAAVIHSNDLSVAEAYDRAIDEVVGVRKIGTVVPVLRRRDVARLAVRGSLLDGARILTDREFGIRSKAKWFFVNPAYQWSKWRGQRVGTLAIVEVEAAALAPRPAR